MKKFLKIFNIILICNSMFLLIMSTQKFKTHEYYVSVSYLMVGIISTFVTTISICVNFKKKI